MLFSSITFLYYFLPWTVVIYFLMPGRFRNLWLLLASLFFYGWGEPRFLIFMIGSVVQGYIFGRIIEKYAGNRRSDLALAASVILSLGLLAYCKYADFFLESMAQLTGLALPLLKITLPIGISFYTFQVLSYVIDVHRGKAAAQKSFVNLALYIAMFPQLIAGPIVRYTDLEHQLSHRTHTWEQTYLGLRRFLMGLAKKVCLANVLAESIQHLQSAGTTTLGAWLIAIAYTLQIYFDFSGYSDMAIGLGRIFGFHFPENFNYPYISGSITEFWRRWHISLGTWFRDYLYIPMGGNRVSTGKWLRNILMVWMATGLWHGAAWNFVLWGLLYGILLMIEKIWTIRSHTYTLLFVTLGFVLFQADSLTGALTHLQALVGIGTEAAVNPMTLYQLRNYGFVFILAAIGATPLPRRIVEYLTRKRSSTQKLQEEATSQPRQTAENLTGKTNSSSRLQGAAEYLYLLALLAICTGFLVDGSFNPFLYFRF